MKTLPDGDRRKNDKDLIEFLLSVSEFNMLSDDEMEMLDKIMVVDNYRGGHKFESADNVYLIIDGEVAVTHKRKCGTLQLDRMHAGELFGVFSLIDNSKRSARCTALGSVRAASIPRSAFELLFKSNLPLSNHFQHIVAHQMVPDMHATAGGASSNCCNY
ncbi:MAG: cyclic nucleotide-binding domain-containing protein [Granulosicoccaceae bacterium]|jgi:signal-transduction protein with cAMP-binding, CBS, and nucleotidyltransferase domain